MTIVAQKICRICHFSRLSLLVMAFKRSHSTPNILGSTWFGFQQDYEFFSKTTQLPRHHTYELSLIMWCTSAHPSLRIIPILTYKHIPHVKNISNVWEHEELRPKMFFELNLQNEPSSYAVKKERTTTTQHWIRKGPCVVVCWCTFETIWVERTLVHWSWAL